MEFKEWKDMLDFNRKLMEDDWNDGKQYVFKTKHKAGDIVGTDLMFQNLNLRLI